MRLLTVSVTLLMSLSPAPFLFQPEAVIEGAIFVGGADFRRMPDWGPAKEVGSPWPQRQFCLTPLTKTFGKGAPKKPLAGS
jgi:hypothetical protein